MLLQTESLESKHKFLATSLGAPINDSLCKGKTILMYLERYRCLQPLIKYKVSDSRACPLLNILSDSHIYLVVPSRVSKETILGNIASLFLHSFAVVTAAVSILTHDAQYLSCMLQHITVLSNEIREVWQWCPTFILTPDSLSLSPTQTHSI